MENSSEASPGTIEFGSEQGEKKSDTSDIANRFRKAAKESREKGSASVELKSQDLRQVILNSIELFSEDAEKSGIKLDENPRLEVSLEGESAKVSFEGKDMQRKELIVGWVTNSNVSGDFLVKNSPKGGLLVREITASPDVYREDLERKIGGEKINGVFRKMVERQLEGESLEDYDIGFQITSDNKLKIEFLSDEVASSITQEKEDRASKEDEKKSKKKEDGGLPPWLSAREELENNPRVAETGKVEKSKRLSQIKTREKLGEILKGLEKEGKEVTVSSVVDYMKLEEERVAARTLNLLSGKGDVEDTRQALRSVAGEHLDKLKAVSLLLNSQTGIKVEGLTNKEEVKKLLGDFVVTQRHMQHLAGEVLTAQLEDRGEELKEELFRLRQKSFEVYSEIVSTGEEIESPLSVTFEVSVGEKEQAKVTEPERKEERAGEGRERFLWDEVRGHEVIKVIKKKDDQEDEKEVDNKLLVWRDADNSVWLKNLQKDGQVSNREIKGKKIGSADSEDGAKELINKVVKGEIEKGEKSGSFRYERGYELDGDGNLVRKEELISDGEFDRFVKTGEVDKKYLELVVDKLKRGQELTEREEAIRQEYSNEVEVRLANESKVEEEDLAFEEETLENLWNRVKELRTEKNNLREEYEKTDNRDTLQRYEEAVDRWADALINYKDYYDIRVPLAWQYLEENIPEDLKEDEIGDLKKAYESFEYHSDKLAEIYKNAKYKQGQEKEDVFKRDYSEDFEDKAGNYENRLRLLQEAYNLLKEKGVLIQR